MDPNEARLGDPAEGAEEGNGNNALAFKNCRNILLRDITILQGGHFCLYALGCSGMTIDNLRVDTDRDGLDIDRSEEHTSELQSLMRNSYAVFCLKKKKNIDHNTQ